MCRIHHRHRRDRNACSSVLANCRFNWRLWANYKSNLSTFCAACGLRVDISTCECVIWVCLWQHPHLLYVKHSGCRRFCQSEKNMMRSDGECARREQDGVNRVCVRIAWTRNKLISTICSQFRDGLPMYRSCARSDANFLRIYCRWYR